MKRWQKFEQTIAQSAPGLPRHLYSIERASFNRLEKLNLPYFYNVDDFSKACGVSPRQILFYAAHKRRAYVSFKVLKKKGGFRIIDAPCKNLKLIQRWILDNILNHLNVSSSCHGFTQDRSIVTNAEIHVNQPLILNIDLKDFFPSIKTNRVKGLFKQIGYTEKISELFAEICTFNWHLPQGAPTSPMLANLVAWHLDIKLENFCEKKGYLYSRYADDITISGNRRLPRHKRLIYNIIEEEGFSINWDKIRLHDRGSAQKVTGLIVNDKISIGREKKRLLRAKIHNIARFGPERENRLNHPFFREVILGEIGFANAVDPVFANKLYDEIKDVDWTPSQDTVERKTEQLYLRSLKRTRNSFVIPFERLGFFKEINEIPDVKRTPEFISMMNGLREKCPFHSAENCEDCLFVARKEDFLKCIKYIIGCFVGSSGGAHHGQEIFDVSGNTEFDDKSVLVAFILKASRDTASKNSLTYQFYKVIHTPMVDVIGIVTSHELDHDHYLTLQSMMEENREEKIYCLIQRRELGRIIVALNNKILLEQ